MNFEPSKRSQVEPFYAMEVFKMANAAVKSGKEIIRLEAGEPCTPPPQKVLDKIIEFLKSNKPIGYTVAGGIDELKNRIAKNYLDNYGIEVNPDRIIITYGASGAFSLSYISLFDKGMNIGIQNPGYPAYRNTAIAHDLNPILIPTTLETRFMPTADILREVHKKTPLNGLILASPSNPTGTIIPKQQFIELVEFTKSENIRLISDEIYHGLSYLTHPAETALALDDNAFIINSFSKYYSMTGWRIGWMVVPENFIKPVTSVQQNNNICTSLLSQLAAVEVLDAKNDLERIKAGYLERRNILIEELPKTGLKNICPMDGAFYAYGELPANSPHSYEVAKKLLAEKNISLTPGVDFDPINGDKWLRMSYAGSTRDINLAMERLNGYFS